MSSPTSIVAYLALFAAMGFAFLFVNLLIGRLLRPQDPHPEKLEVYECGEPTIGSSFVQFDLRVYVVALLFIIFDVEVAFFFPWATVFGKATHLMDPHMQKVTAEAQLTPNATALFAELGVQGASVATVDPRMHLDQLLLRFAMDAKVETLGDLQQRTRRRGGFARLGERRRRDVGVFGFLQEDVEQPDDDHAGDDHRDGESGEEDAERLDADVAAFVGVGGGRVEMGDFVLISHDGLPSSWS